MKELLKAVCLRLSGRGGEVSSIIRLGTQYGGGKTHALIALVHAVRGMKGVPTPEKFVDPAILPAGTVRIAALDGENADPANGLTLEPGLLARSLWGEMAYRLAGRDGYERVRVSDEKHIAPGAETIRELFGGQPTLILLDEISVYLRKVERTFPDASKQFAAFVHDLFKAVASTPQAALVYTLAVGKDDKAGDAYKEENERAAAAMLTCPVFCTK
jgi:predicted AAA+ superfamily ATPase